MYNKKGKQTVEIRGNRLCIEIDLEKSLFPVSCHNTIVMVGGTVLHSKILA
jgi:hypothetical protein